MTVLGREVVGDQASLWGHNTKPQAKRPAASGIAQDTLRVLYCILNWLESLGQVMPVQPVRQQDERGAI